jgi:ASC-1-like (ASCH) protein
MDVLSVTTEWYECIANGTKVWEGRLNKGKYTFTIGSKIVINCSEEPSRFVVKTVVDIRKYPNFKMGLIDLGWSRILPKVETLKEAEAVYESFYPLEEQEKYGVIFFKLY